jgi:hypothetical protein
VPSEQDFDLGHGFAISSQIKDRSVAVVCGVDCRLDKAITEMAIGMDCMVIAATPILFFAEFQ